MVNNVFVSLGLILWLFFTERSLKTLEFFFSVKLTRLTILIFRKVVLYFPTHHYIWGIPLSLILTNTRKEKQQGTDLSPRTPRTIKTRKWETLQWKSMYLGSNKEHEVNICCSSPFPLILLERRHRRQGEEAVERDGNTNLWERWGSQRKKRGQFGLASHRHSWGIIWPAMSSAWETMSQTSRHSILVWEVVASHITWLCWHPKWTH